MENIITRYRNFTILVAVLFAQFLGLAMQVKRTTDSQSTLLIRVWAVSTVTPLEKAFVFTTHGIRNVWRNYFYLRGVRRENRELQAEISQMRLEQARLAEDAAQAHRLQALLGFKEQFISQTMPAQVIGSSGSDQSRIIYIDKGARDGLKVDIDQPLPVITDQGIIGRVLRVFHSSSQVLLVNDTSSGVGAILEKSRLQGVLKGTPSGDAVLDKVMSDEQVEPGERVLTSGGDRIFPKGLLIGYVRDVRPGADLFLRVRVRLSANLSKAEEVLVITKVDEREPTAAEARGPVRAIDILTNRLPSVPVKPPSDQPANSEKTPSAAANGGGSAPKTTAGKPAEPKTGIKPNATASVHSVPGVASEQSPALKNKVATSTSTTPRPKVKPAVSATTGATTSPAVAQGNHPDEPVKAPAPAPMVTAPAQDPPAQDLSPQNQPPQGHRR